MPKLIALRMNDGHTYRLTGRSTSNCRSWIAFDDNGEAVGVLSWKSGGLSKGIAEKMLGRRWPNAALVRGARRVEG
jgi:hypothetical protein